MEVSVQPIVFNPLLFLCGNDSIKYKKIVEKREFHKKGNNFIYEVKYDSLCVPDIQTLIKMIEEQIVEMVRKREKVRKKSNYNLLLILRVFFFGNCYCLTKGLFSSIIMQCKEVFEHEKEK